jgi:hypothetical protein
MSPDDSEDLTEVIANENETFIVYWSPETAEHEPDYCELGRFSSRTEAEKFLNSDP